MFSYLLIMLLTPPNMFANLRSFVNDKQIIERFEKSSELKLKEPSIVLVDLKHLIPLNNGNISCTKLLKQQKLVYQ